VAIVPATKFKAQCLELMDRVAERRATYVITKRGKPVAKLVPADPPKRKSVFGCMADETEFVSDLDQPAWSEEEWKGFPSAGAGSESPAGRCGGRRHGTRNRRSAMVHLLAGPGCRRRRSRLTASPHLARNVARKVWTPAGSTATSARAMPTASAAW
jgi:prevent-host-death family protein